MKSSWILKAIGLDRSEEINERARAGYLRACEDLRKAEADLKKSTAIVEAKGST